jgi:acyl-[acyl-carrier-protein] desaturase
MVCYGALQEQATMLIYKAQERRAERTGNQVLRRVFQLVSRDEAAHMGWYRRLFMFHLAEDRDGSLRDLAHVIAHFKMPGLPLIPNYEERLGTEGVGITPAEFLEFGLYPTLRFFGTTRRELMRVGKLKPSHDEPAKERLALAAEHS